MFREVPVSIIRSFPLHTQQWCMPYSFADSLRARFCSQAVSKTVWHTSLLCLQWKTPDDGHRNYPKHVEFYSKNKFEKLVYLVGFIIRIRTNYETMLLLTVRLRCHQLKFTSFESGWPAACVWQPHCTFYFPSRFKYDSLWYCSEKKFLALTCANRND